MDKMETDLAGTYDGQKWSMCKMYQESINVALKQLREGLIPQRSIYGRMSNHTTERLSPHVPKDSKIWDDGALPSVLTLCVIASDNWVAGMGPCLLSLIASGMSDCSHVLAN
jgi:hypothetical protein